MIYELIKPQICGLAYMVLKVKKYSPALGSLERPCKTHNY